MRNTKKSIIKTYDKNIQKIAPIATEYKSKNTPSSPMKQFIPGGNSMLMRTPDTNPFNGANTGNITPKSNSRSPSIRKS